MVNGDRLAVFPVGNSYIRSTRDRKVLGCQMAY